MAPPKKKKTSSSSALASHSDFTKAKSSLKAKQRAVPNNATNTAFKARSIVLPNQGSITQLEERRSTKLTDDRGRGVEELVTLLRGVGQGGSKSEALDSLASLLLRLPDGTTTGLGLLPILLPLITSSSAPVRTSLYRLLDHFLRAVPRDALAPYITTITLWLTSGMNHIWKEVREDAARIAEVAIEITSHDLVRGWSWTSSSATAAGQAQEEVSSNGERFFRTLLTALGVSFEIRGAAGSTQAGGSGGAASTSTASTMNVQSDLSASPTTKLRLLLCLEKLIRYQSGLGASDEGREQDQDDSGASGKTFPLWIFRSVFANPTDWEGFAAKWEGSRAEVDVDLRGSRPGRKEIAPFTTSLALLERQGGVDFTDVSSSAGLVLSESDLSKTLSSASSLFLGNSLVEGYQHSSAGPSATSSRSTSMQPYLQLYHALHPLLLHTFLDHAPGSLGPAAPMSNRSQDTPLGLKLINIVLTLARTLFRATLRSNDETSAGGSTQGLRGVEKESLSRLGVLLGHTAIYFPFEGSLNGEEGSKKAAVLKRISAGWCELVGLQQMLSGEGNSSAVKAAKSEKGKEVGAGALHLETVESYLVDLLHSSSQQPSSLHEISLAASSTSSGTRLSEGEYLSLLPTIWHLLTSSQPAKTSTTTSSATSAASSEHLPLLSALLSHWSSLKSSNPLKAHGFTFLASLCSLPNYPSLRADLSRTLTRPSSPLARLLRSGLLASGNQLGKYLYELASSLPGGGRNAALPTPSALQAAQVALRQLRAAFSLLLLDGLRCDSPYLLESAHLYAHLLPTLAPFFWIQHPSRGEVPGPWRRVEALAAAVVGAESGLASSVWEAQQVRRAVEALVEFVQEDTSGEGERTEAVLKFLKAARKAGVTTWN
jgi:pre-rRNA-processing protein IPI1